MKESLKSSCPTVDWLLQLVRVTHPDLVEHHLATVYTALSSLTFRIFRLAPAAKVNNHLGHARVPSMGVCSSKTVLPSPGASDALAARIEPHELQ
jgi:hypothetical protein